MGKVFFAGKALRVKHLEIFYGEQGLLLLLLLPNAIIICGFTGGKNSYIFRTTLLASQELSHIQLKIFG